MRMEAETMIVLKDEMENENHSPLPLRPVAVPTPNGHLFLTLKLEMGRSSNSHLGTCRDMTPHSRIPPSIQKFDQ
ncbi:hypothetical protein L484_005401 [Morus notabilis]|uniref:Uncharacterized protein n=1 Tax=Morus notabilis TaxID=981085 RepID=W9RQ73_9ROSA|nr:hypothetical protein L484_005401 [Morus notabilis]